MKNKINIWSFVLAIICVLLFSNAISIGDAILGIHPLNLVFFITLITLVLGVVGFSGIQNWKGMARSITTVILTLGLSVYLTFVLFIGSLIN